MRTSTSRPAGKVELEAARLLLERVGVSLADLTAAAASGCRPAPTFAEYVPTVSAAVSAATRRVYGSYCNKSRLRHRVEPLIDETTQTCDIVSHRTAAEECGFLLVAQYRRDGFGSASYGGRFFLRLSICR